MSAASTNRLHSRILRAGHPACQETTTNRAQDRIPTFLTCQRAHSSTPDKDLRSHAFACTGEDAGPVFSKVSAETYLAGAIGNLAGAIGNEKWNEPRLWSPSRKPVVKQRKSGHSPIAPRHRRANGHAGLRAPDCSSPSAWMKRC